MTGEFESEICIPVRVKWEHDGERAEMVHVAPRNQALIERLNWSRLPLADECRLRGEMLEQVANILREREEDRQLAKVF